MAKITQKVRVIKQEYWSCGLDRPKHYHLSEQAARNCLRRQASKGKPRLPPAEKCKRDRHILQQHIDGKTYTSIAKKVGLTATTVSKICHKFLRHVYYRVSRADGAVPEFNWRGCEPTAEQLEWLIQQAHECLAYEQTPEYLAECERQRVQRLERLRRNQLNWAIDDVDRAMERIAQSILETKKDAALYETHVDAAIKRGSFVTAEELETRRGGYQNRLELLGQHADALQNKRLQLISERDDPQ